MSTVAILSLSPLLYAMDEAPVFLDRTSRVTRGKRMTTLLDEEIQDDDLFWNQDALRDEEEDNNYEEEAEVADEFDSDFNEDEPEPDEENVNEVEERVRPKKRLIFPGKTLATRKKKQMKKALSKLKDEDNHSKGEDEDDDDANDDDDEAERTDRHNEAHEDGERIVRKSTRTAVINRQAEREAIRAALQATMRPIKKKKEGEDKRMSQEEMLLEAAQTEIVNLRNLERVLAREEEVKKRAIVNKAVYTGPQIRYYSKDGSSYLEFSRGASFKSALSTTSVPYPKKAVCAVTGLPAKYRDPKTGLPYATKEAFQILRQRFLNENTVVRKYMDMGNLCESLSGNGSWKKQKRSATLHNPEVSYSRQFARFRRIHSVDEGEEEEKEEDEEEEEDTDSE